MDLTHWMDVEQGDGGALVLTCPERGCGRRVLVSGSSDITVLDTGDFFSRHVASVGPLVMAAELGS